MDTFLSRRPVVDASQQVFAFQIRHRHTLEDDGAELDEIAANRVVSDMATLLGIDTVSGGRRVFVPTTRNLLIQEFARVLPAERTVLEIDASTEIDDALRTSIADHRAEGYAVCLRGLPPGGASHPLVDAADFLSVSLRDVPAKSRQTVTESMSRTGKLLLAEDIPNWRVFKQAMHLGFTHGVGEFYGQPVMLSGKDVSAAKSNLMQVLLEVNQSDVDFDRIEAIIKRDAALGYKLLRYINSAFHAVRTEITSIMHAVVLLGERELKRWISLIALTSLAPDKPSDLLSLGMLRARFLELLAPHANLGDRDQELFLVGLLSALDGVLDAPLPSILAPLPLADDLRVALLQRKNPIGNLLLAGLAYVDGNWEKFGEHASEAGLRESEAPAAYQSALAWTEKSFADVTEVAA